MATYQTIEARRSRAAELLSNKGAMSLGELCQAMGVSESTARRDLESLEAAGVVRRTHGGAVCTRYPLEPRLGFEDRRTSMLAQKQAIGRAAAALIPDGQTVIIDGGTTCHQVAAALAGRNLSVVTNSVPIASLLFNDLSCEVTLLGGYLYPRTGVALGATVVRQLSELRASTLVMSCCGLGPDGAFNINQMLVDVERQMMESADRIIMAVDHSKFGRRGLARLCDVGDIDVLVTDGDVQPAELEWVRSLGVEVIVTEGSMQTA